MKRMLLIIFITSILSYAAMCLIMYIAQRGMLYLPSFTPIDEQLAFARGAGLKPWLDPAGVRIGWKREAPGPGPTQQWLVFHGNAGLAVQRACWVDALERISPGASVSVFILEYPGYGGRAGSPSESAITAAALAAFDSLPAAGRTHMLGESLGCAVAARVAQVRSQRAGGLVLVAPFNRLADVAGHHYPWIPVRWLLRDPWTSDENLRNFPGPVAVLAAERDAVAPVRFAQRLYDGYAGRKWLFVIPGEEHNFFVFDQPWFREAVTFATAEAMSLDR